MTPLYARAAVFWRLCRRASAMLRDMLLVLRDYAVLLRQEFWRLSVIYAPRCSAMLICRRAMRR
jgi:hypothetical protein